MLILMLIFIFILMSIFMFISMLDSMLIFTSKKSITKHILRKWPKPKHFWISDDRKRRRDYKKIKNLSLWPTTQTRDYPVPPPCRQGRQEGGPIGVREPVCEGFIVTLRYRFNLKRNKILARARRAQAVRLLTGRWRSSPHLGSVKLGLCGWWRSILTLDFPIPGAFKKTTFYTFVTSLLGELPLFFKMSRSSLGVSPMDPQTDPLRNPPLWGDCGAQMVGPQIFIKKISKRKRKQCF